MDGDIPYAVDGFVDPTPSDPIDKQDILIWNISELNGSVKDLHKDFKTVFTDSSGNLVILDSHIKNTNDSLVSVNQNLSDLLVQSGNGDSTLQDGNTQTLQKLDSISDMLGHISTGSDTIVTYGILYLPLFMVCFLLWRFFRTFLRS